MASRSMSSMAFFCLLAALLATSYAQDTSEAFRRAKSTAYVAGQHSRTLKTGWFNSFIPMSLDSLKSVFTAQKDPTVTASSSLTGLPWIMTFEQQFDGGLPVAQFPNLPSSTQSKPSTQPRPAQQTPPAPPQPAPAKQAAPTPSQPTPAPAPTACSTTDRSGSAVFNCINAMRTDPGAWTAHYNCDWRSWINAASSPRRPPLNADGRLSQSAAEQAKQMAATRTVSHVGSDGSTMAQRISAAGFTTFPQAENVAGRQQSALEVSAGWMCSQDHRLNIMSCDVDSAGVATSYDVDGIAYYVQDFGCSRDNSCHC